MFNTTPPARKKIYYVPGCLSLVMVPFLFIHLTNEARHERSLGVIPFVMGDAAFVKSIPELAERYGNHFPPLRNYTEINFTGNENSDLVKLHFAKIRTEEMLSPKTYENGLHFRFGGQSRYGTFLKSVDMLRSVGAKTYMALGKDLWFYTLPPDTSANTMFCCMLCGDIVTIRPKVSQWQIFINWLTRIWRTSWQIITAFAVFLFLRWKLRKVNEVRL